MWKALATPFLWKVDAFVQSYQLLSLQPAATNSSQLCAIFMPITSVSVDDRGRIVDHFYLTNKHLVDIGKNNWNGIRLAENKMFIIMPFSS